MWGGTKSNNGSNKWGGRQPWVEKGLDELSRLNKGGDLHVRTVAKIHSLLVRFVNVRVRVEFYSREALCSIVDRLAVTLTINGLRHRYMCPGNIPGIFVMDSQAS